MRRLFLLLPLVLIGSAKWLNAETTASRPNIIFILADDLDFDEIGVYEPREYPSRTGAHLRGLTTWREDWRYYPDPRMHTPHIDSLATDGMRLDRFYVTSAVCTPSRYAFMTGRYASRSLPFLERYPPGTEAFVTWNTQLGTAEPNLARALSGLGYYTGLVGKWHLGFPFAQIDPLPADADPADPNTAAQIRRNYELSVETVRQEFGWDHVDRLWLLNKEGGALGLPDALRHHNQEWLTAGALEFIHDRAGTDQPFFLYFALTVPHSQFDGIYGEFRGADPLASPAGRLSQPATGQPSRASIDTRLRERGISPRNAMATWIDDSVGAILAELEALDIADNTLVIFTSDHQSRGKFTAYEGSRVPFLARWPDHVPAGITVDALTANIDVAPTLVELAGGKPRELGKVDGRSLLPLLQGKVPAQWRDSLLLEIAYSRAVVTRDWKLLVNRPVPEALAAFDADRLAFAATGQRRTVHWSGRSNPHGPWWGEEGIRYVADVDFPHFFDFDQLYHLHTDPFEQVNVIDHPEYRDTTHQLKAQLREHLASLPHAFGEFSRGKRD
jgi:arylsulfatase A-like enzyme